MRQDFTMDVSIGVMAHNEGKKIARALESLFKQKLNKINIKEIIVVSSGSTDNTDDVVRRFCKKNKNIKLVTEPKRKGKSSAINKFLGLVTTDFIVLGNADIIVKKDAVRKLCMPLLNNQTGICIGRPVSIYGRYDFLGYITNLVWDLYHLISLRNPKYGELIAFRHLFDKIEDTSVDEEYIGMLVSKSGLKTAYLPDAVYYNAGPRTLKGFVEQRRRIFAGHFFLNVRRKHKASTMNVFEILRSMRKIPDKRIKWVIFAIGLEFLGRALGMYDYLRKREAVVWKIAK